MFTQLHLLVGNINNTIFKTSALYLEIVLRLKTSHDHNIKTIVGN